MLLPSSRIHPDHLLFFFQRQTLCFQFQSNMLYSRLILLPIIMASVSESVVFKILSVYSIIPRFQHDFLEIFMYELHINLIQRQKKKAELIFSGFTNTSKYITTIQDYRNSSKE